MPTKLGKGLQRGRPLCGQVPFVWDPGGHLRTLLRALCAQACTRQGSALPGPSSRSVYCQAESYFSTPRRLLPTVLNRWAQWDVTDYTYSKKEMPLCYPPGGWDQLRSHSKLEVDSDRQRHMAD